MARRGPAALLVMLSGTLALAAPPIDGTDLARAREMLAAIRLAVRDHYYDPTFGGRDIESLFTASRGRLEAAATVAETYDIIAATVAALSDSHTFFIPPLPDYDLEYGWAMTPAGDACFVSAVDPGSDAAAKGLQPGDRVLDIEAVAPHRRSCSLQHAAYVLNPKAELRLLVESPAGARRAVAVQAIPKAREPIAIDPDNLYGVMVQERERRFRASRVARAGPVTVWRLPDFEFTATEMTRVAHLALQGTSALVLDLRGNGGGSVDALAELTRHFFTRQVHIADLKSRRRVQPLRASGRRQSFTGPLVVLVNGTTASAGEIFARLVQIEQRGTIIGDRTAGSVRQSRTWSASVPAGWGVLTYGVSISEADIVMRDGRSLEGTGVTPDVVHAPGADDFAGRRDPVLAAAVAMLGGSLDPAAAARLFTGRP